VFAALCGLSCFIFLELLLLLILLLEPLLAFVLL
jgi:hypothetical protein